MAILTTCLNRPDTKAEMRDLLLRNLYDQLGQFAQGAVPDDVRRQRSLVIDAMGLRTRLAGSLLDLIQKHPTSHLTDWAFLLSQLLTSGCVDPVESPELFENVFDFFTVLMLTVVANDQPALAAVTGAASGGADKTAAAPMTDNERKYYLVLVKKIRKECGERRLAGVEWVKMLLPLQRRTPSVIAVEPFGTVTDAKGVKNVAPVPNESADRKHSLQVRISLFVLE